MDLAVSLVICGLAVWQAVEVWHHGEIFADWRSVTESWAYLPGRLNAPRRFVSELLACAWCTSVWTGWIVVGLWQLPWSQWFVLGLAVSRVANVCHDLHSLLSKGRKYESKTWCGEDGADGSVSEETGEEATSTAEDEWGY